MKKIIALTAMAFVLMSAGTQTNVYVSQSGKKYHTHKDCQYIKNSDGVKTITIEQAQKDGKTLCSRCKAKDNKNNNK